MTTSLTRPHHSSFTLMWANNATFTKNNMVRHTAVLRGVGEGGLHGLTCRKLYVDQITVVYRDPNSIQSTQFVAGDSVNFTWNLETILLHLGVTPGLVQNAWTVKPNNPDNVQHAYQFSNSYTQHNTGQISMEGYYIKVYRPTRDVPVAVNLQGVGNLSFHLMFPMIFLSTTFPYVDLPDYRIQYIIMEMSAEE